MTGKVSLPGIPTHRQDHPSGGCSQNTQHRSRSPNDTEQPIHTDGVRTCELESRAHSDSQKTFRPPAHRPHANRRREVPGETGSNGGLRPKSTPKMLRQTPAEPTEAAARHPQLGVASTQTPNTCHGLGGESGKLLGSPRDHHHPSSSSGQKHTSLGCLRGSLR